MGAAFGLDVDAMELLAVELIQEGRIKARVDSTKKVSKFSSARIKTLPLAYGVGPIASTRQADRSTSCSLSKSDQSCCANPEDN